MLRCITSLPVVVPVSFSHVIFLMLLQRDLADARGALQKQWRELSASFEDQLRHVEMECNAKLEQATQQMELACRQAAEHESEACEAHSKERGTAEAAAVGPLGDVIVGVFLPTKP